MKTLRTLAACLPVLCLVISCSKSSKEDTPPVDNEPDRSNCLWTSVDFFQMNQAPFSVDDRSFEYDSQKRISMKKYPGIFKQYIYEAGKIRTITYLNSVSLANIASRSELTIRASDSRIIEELVTPTGGATSTRTIYEYDGNGYLVGEKKYFGNNLEQEMKYTYSNGNLTSREDIDHFTNSTGKLTYKYDNAANYPEAYVLPEMVDLVSGTPVKNNVTEIIVERPPRNGWGDTYKSIKFEYVKKGNRLAEVKMVSTTAQGKSVDGTITFGYTCP